MHRAIPVTCAAILVLWLAAGSGLVLAKKTKKKNESETSRTVSFATYKEQAGRVTLVLGTQIASIDPDVPFVPFQIAVGVWGEGADLIVNRSSFALIDARGGVHPLAPMREVLDRGKVSYFRQAARLSPLNDGNTFDRYRRLSAAFYPQTAGPVGKELIEMTRDTYFEDIVYFPRPESGLDGVLTLQFVAHGIDAPVRLRFEVPIGSER